MSEHKFSTRVLTQDDIALVGELEKIEFRTQKNAWNAQSLMECFDDSYVIIGLFYVDRIIGFSVVYNAKFTNDLLTIGVDPDFQGRKLGSRLLYDTLKKVVELKCVECFLEVRVSNAVAISLYEKFGFKKVGVRKGYYNPVGSEPAEDAYTMHLDSIEQALERITL